MSFNAFCRLAIILGWLALFGYHAGGRLLLSLGVWQQRDAAAIVQTHVNHSYSYDLTANGVAIGQIGQRYEFEDGRYPVSVDVSVNKLDFIPGINFVKGTLETNFDIDLSQGIQITILTILSSDCRLKEAELDGHIGGREISFAGKVMHDGLRGTVDLGLGAPPEQIHLQQFSSLSTQGVSFAGSLPAGLQPGDSFTVPSFSPTAVWPFLEPTLSHYQVGDWERREVLDGQRELLQVELHKDGKVLAELWIDERGALWESLDPATGIRLTLKSHHKDSILLWPDIERGR